MNNFLDFDKMLNDTVDEIIDDPRDIFDLLNKDGKFEGTLRPGQEMVLKKWYENYKDQNTSIIKMNTGNGKTVVGLLILQSYLNNGQGPAVYIVPDNFLVNQVVQEAESLGLSVTKDVNSSEFLDGSSILVINTHKIFNGRSVFGVNQQKIEIGSIIIDDAHASVNIVKNQYKITIPRDTNVDLYNYIFNIFKDSIIQQSSIREQEIQDWEPNVQQLVPYWSWNDHLSEIQSELNSYKSKRTYNESLFYNWNLIKDNLGAADCIISSSEILITLEYVPIETIPSFDNCSHKIFMSATIEDDTVIATYFNVDIENLSSAITPNKANDIGERMILIPQRLDTQIGDNDLKKLFLELSHIYNVLIMVPSGKRADFWNDVANVVVDNQEELVETVHKMKEGLVGIVVIKNRYDGIDLPKSACNVLVLDGLPDTRNGYDRFEENVLFNTSKVTLEKIQKIEQGMGRATRSREDYSVVFLMGKNLVSMLNKKNQQMFTGSTQKQLKISEAITSQLKSKQNINTLNALYKASKVCLDRDTGWIEAHKKAILSEKYDPEINVDVESLKMKKSFDLYRNREYQSCLSILEKLANEQENQLRKGYIKFKLAKYMNIVSKSKSQEILKSASKLNNNILYPLEGIQYKKIQVSDDTQANKVMNYISHFESVNDYILNVQNIVNNLKFSSVSAPVFEDSIKKVGQLLGFISERPEKETGLGPDNFWAGSSEYCFVIECKNEAVEETINKRYCNQLNGSINWFKLYYKGVLTQTPIMIHPSTVFEHAATPNEAIRIIDSEMLDKLKSHILNFSNSVAHNPSDIKEIDKQLQTCLLSYSLISQNFTKQYHKKN
ncbi:DEAD/DEAH box helicase family protein [Leuconostoc suionicum]|uniref:DEAD/DEAH box helicase family protein n=1 Tax=Leuconostoc suionicum TaxID=1511761 RepID=UPI00233E7517|nr:DEAD/DEAH box helicase family protein [Leuconostoc suionicum]MDC2805124.1 DEAD/DEAH box helicase family protein [Leuconostoc suionicum]MDC2822636.1 DEAD/DEAH box helicase family protein [Leuconostoc suionicum]